jgi:alpha-1,3-rhamnosyl/mannosyltransferase
VTTEQPSDRLGARVRIGVDARKLLDDRRGIGRYTRALLRSWAARWQDRVAITLLVPDIFPSLLARSLSAEIGSELAVARTGARGFDLVWYPWNGMTWVAQDTKVATVHDCWPFASPAQNSAIRRNEQAPFLRTAEHAACIITDSVFGKSEVVRHLGFDPDKIEVVPLGVDAPRSVAAKPAATASASPEPDYVLFVGQAETRKDLPTLLAAMDLLPDMLRSRFRLVVAGKDQPGSGARLPEHARVAFEGEVSDERLAQLYANASAFVFPSRYEGFGLPILEAMSYGAPVVASDAASLPEAAGDAALYFPVGDAAALAAAIGIILYEPALAQRLRIAGRIRAASMTWERCADATLAVFERVARATQ